jgi:hypothetical protein
MTVSAFAENRHFSENVKQFSLDMAFSAFAEIGLSTEMTRQSIDFKQYFFASFQAQQAPAPHPPLLRERARVIRRYDEPRG